MGLAATLQEKTTFTFNAEGCSLLEYPMDEARAWFRAAIPSVVDMMLLSQESFKGVGSFGSIWFDCYIDVMNKVRKVRVSLMGQGDIDDLQGFCLMLDFTFSDSW